MGVDGISLFVMLTTFTDALGDCGLLEREPRVKEYMIAFLGA